MYYISTVAENEVSARVGGREKNLKFERLINDVNELYAHEDARGEIEMCRRKPLRIQPTLFVQARYAVCVERETGRTACFLVSSCGRCEK